MWLGCADPVQSIEIAREEDPERLELSEMLTAWGNTIGIGSGASVTLANVIALIEKVDQENPYSEKEPVHPELLTAVMSAVYTVTRRRGQKPDVKSLGIWLRDRKRRIVDGRRFANKANPKGGSEWWVEEAEMVTGGEAAAAAAKTEKRAAETVDWAGNPPPAPPQAASANGKRAKRF
jgi:hypothetical protein